MNYYYFRKCIFTGTIALLTGLGLGVQAQEQPGKSTLTTEEQKAFEELSSMSLEELLNLKITVASKKAEKISDAAGVISVITKEELQEDI